MTSQLHKSDTGLVEKLCVAIASLDAKDDETLICQTLGPLLSALQEQRTLQGVGVDVDGGSSIPSPLLVACDKGHVACLQFLARYDAAMVGSPLQGSSLLDGSHNTPVHHAAMAGCTDAWTILGNMILRLNMSDNNYVQRTTNANNDDSNIYLTMGSLTNAHDDTPLQMAVSAGHLEFLKTWYQLICSCGDNQHLQIQIQAVLERPNKAGDTCVTLACCHGHVDIVDFLLQVCHVKVTHEQVEMCQQAVQRIDGALRQLHDNPQALATCQRRQEQVHACLEKLQQALARQVEAATQELLLTDETNTTKTTATTAPVNSHWKQKNKKKKKPSKSIQPTNSRTLPCTNGTTVDAANPNREKVSKEGENDDGQELISLKQLEDGRVAVCVVPEQAHAHARADLEGNSSLSVVTTPPLSTPSVETMFRQRFRGGADPQRQPTATIAPSPSSSSLDATMDALCLDVAMLLYTPHGMALNLSPSQLDAVEQILQQQVLSIQEARELQRKMHQTTTTTTTTTTTETTTTISNNTASKNPS